MNAISLSMMSILFLLISIFRDPKGRLDHEDQLDQEVRKDGLVEWVAKVPLDYPEQM